MNTINPLHGPRTEVADQLHQMKYRSPGEDFREAMNRISVGLKDSDEHYHQFRDILLNMRFLPGGRIQSAIGSLKNVTALNCYVSSTIEDSFVDGPNCIMDCAWQAAATMRMGGGIGYNWGTLRPRNALIHKLQSHSSGPVSFMRIFNEICLATSSAGHRRGAQMGVLPVSHPDILEFVQAKQNTDQLTGFNISVAATDKFMEAALNGKPFDLTFKGEVYNTVDAAELWEAIMRSTWDYAEPGILFIDRINELNNLYYCETIAATNPCLAEGTLVDTPQGQVLIETLQSGDLIYTIAGPRPITSIESHYNLPVYEVTFTNGLKLKATAAHIFYSAPAGSNSDWSNNKRLDKLKPGDFVAQVLQIGDNGITLPREILSITSCGNSTVYDIYEETTDTWITSGVVNRGCGEQPLPPLGCCLLGSFNLVRYLHRDDQGYYFAWDQFVEDIPVVVRAMDNVTDRSKYPLPEQKLEALSKRRMGLGYTGLANTAEALGFPYGSPEFVQFEKDIGICLRNHSYLASSLLARDKGSFPLFDAEKYGQGKFIQTLPDEIQWQIEKYGIRNSHLTSIAPTGTISMCADNVSSGLEPVFAYSLTRPVNTPSGVQIQKIDDYGAAFLNSRGRLAEEVTAKEHVEVLVTAQQYVDSSVSKTINMDGKTMPWSDFKDIYKTVWESGGKGCSTFNKSGKRMALLSKEEPGDESDFCVINPETGAKSCG